MVVLAGGSGRSGRRSYKTRPSVAFIKYADRAVSFLFGEWGQAVEEGRVMTERKIRAENKERCIIPFGVPILLAVEPG